MEKTLFKIDVHSSTTNHIEFSVSLCKIKNHHFLCDGEDHDLVKLFHDKCVDAFLIGPSIDPDDVEESKHQVDEMGMGIILLPRYRLEGFCGKAWTGRRQEIVDMVIQEDYSEY